MTTSVSIKNEASGGHPPIQVVRRFPATGNETIVCDALAEGEQTTQHVWDDCELVIKEPKPAA